MKSSFSFYHIAQTSQSDFFLSPASSTYICTYHKYLAKQKCTIDFAQLKFREKHNNYKQNSKTKNRNKIYRLISSVDYFSSHLYWNVRSRKNTRNWLRSVFKVRFIYSIHKKTPSQLSETLPFSGGKHI